MQRLQSLAAEGSRVRITAFDYHGKVEAGQASWSRRSSHNYSGSGVGGIRQDTGDGYTAALVWVQ